MAKTLSLTYNRSTTFSFTFNYQKNGVDSTDGQTLFFTVKANPYDTDAADTTAILKKNVAMTGANTTVTLSPGDIADSVLPGTYYFDIMVKESSGPPPVIYAAANGKFILEATPTNREA